MGILTMGGSPATTFSITAPVDITSWTLNPSGTGVNTIAGTMKVTANGDWQVGAADQDATTQGNIDRVGRQPVHSIQYKETWQPHEGLCAVRRICRRRI